MVISFETIRTVQKLNMILLKAGLYNETTCGQATDKRTTPPPPKQKPNIKEN